MCTSAESSSVIVSSHGGRGRYAGDDGMSDKSGGGGGAKNVAWKMAVWLWGVLARVPLADLMGGMCQGVGGLVA